MSSSPSPSAASAEPELPYFGSHVRGGVKSSQAVLPNSKVTASTTYTVYYIEVHTCLGDWTVAHRYSSLLAMHDYIKSNYTYVTPSRGGRQQQQLPKFPGKKLWGNNSEKTINERRLQL